MTQAIFVSFVVDLRFGGQDAWLYRCYKAHVDMVLVADAISDEETARTLMIDIVTRAMAGIPEDREDLELASIQGQSMDDNRLLIQSGYGFLGTTQLNISFVPLEIV